MTTEPAHDSRLDLASSPSKSLAIMNRSPLRNTVDPSPVVQANFISIGDGCSFANKDISFSIYPGEVLWLKGPSGVGKSTLVNILLGLRTTSNIRSEIKWNATIKNSERAGILFQNGVMIDSLSVSENIQLALRVAGKHSKLENVDPLLRAVGLSLDRDGFKHPNHLSGGMHRRASLAQTLAQNKRLVILDEPFTGLDENVAVEVLELIHDMRFNHGVSFILITHEPHIIANMKIDKQITLYPNNVYVEQNEHREGLDTPGIIEDDYSNRNKEFWNSPNEGLEDSLERGVVTLMETERENLHLDTRADTPISLLNRKETLATTQDTLQTSNRKQFDKGDALKSTLNNSMLVSETSTSSSNNKNETNDKTQYQTRLERTMKQNPSKLVFEDNNFPMKLFWKRILNRQWPWRRDRDVSRFILRTIDYFFISLPLIIICFIALGLSVSVLFADVLSKLDPVEIISRAPGELGVTFSRLVNDEDTKKMIRDGFAPFKEDLFAMFVSFVFIIELAPLITALMLSGRIGGSFAGEVATLRATKQETLLRTLGVTLSRWVRVPSYLAAIISIPLLTCIGAFTALLTGSIVGQWRLNSDPVRYWEMIHRFLFETQDINPNVYMWPWLIILYRSIGFAILIILAANIVVSIKKEVHPKHVARLITFAIVLGGVICLIADYGFNSVLESSKQGFKFLKDVDQFDYGNLTRNPDPTQDNNTNPSTPVNNIVDDEWE